MLRHQVTRRFGNGQCKQEVQHGWHGHAQEHPLPGFERPHEHAGATGDVHEQRVDKQRDEDANNDAQLLERSKYTTLVGGRDFRNVDRSHHGRNACRKTTEYTEGDQYEDVRHDGAANRADQKQHGGDLHHRHAADLVGDTTGKQRTDTSGNQRGSNGKTEQRVACGEFGFDGVGRTVDDGGVIAVEQTAECRDQRKPTGYGFVGFNG